MEERDFGEFSYENLFKQVKLSKDEIETIVDDALERCFRESTHLSGELPCGLRSSAVVKRVLTIAKDGGCSLSDARCAIIMNWLEGQWSSSVDIIQYECADAFELLLLIHQMDCKTCTNQIECAFLETISTTVFGSPSVCRARFKCMMHLLNFYAPSRHFLDNEMVAALYPRLSNASLVNTICDLICYDLMRERSRWLLHVDQMLLSLNSPSSASCSAVKNRLLKAVLSHRELVELPALLLETYKSRSEWSSLSADMLIVARLVLSSRSLVWKDVVPPLAIRRALIHSHNEVRLAAWQLLCECGKKTMPFSSEDLLMINVFLSTNMTEQCPSSRQQILAGLKQILIRMGESGEALLKAGEAPIVEQYSSFLLQLVHSCFDSLSPRANFNRRVMAVCVIDFVLAKKFLISNNKRRLWNYIGFDKNISLELFNNLIICLEDPFQLVQCLSMELLSNLRKEYNLQFNDLFVNAGSAHWQGMKTHQITAISLRLQLYLQQYPERTMDTILLYVKMAEEAVANSNSQLTNIITRPIHPLLQVLQSLLEKAKVTKSDQLWWKTFTHEHLLPLCFAVSELVTCVVHNMSPEGYMTPDQINELTHSAKYDKGDLQDRGRLQGEASKQLLACCWRAHSHASHLLAWSIVALCPIYVLPADDVNRIGKYFWLQLTECKHCGAFESAASGYASICTYLWKCQDPEFPSPSKWLDEILQATDGSAGDTSLVQWRRSAGVPLLVTTILETQTSVEPVKHALRLLLQIESKDVGYRIHSLNILKAIFSSSILAEKVTVGLEWGFRVAIDGCSSVNWSERNASAQLAAALRTRVFGVTRLSQRELQVNPVNRKSSYEFFSRFPSMHDFLVEKLVTCDEFGAFPILMVLSHLYSSPSQHTYRLHPFVPVCLNRLIQCKCEKLRRLAAACLAAIVEDEQANVLVRWISMQCSSGKLTSQNYVNALLLLLDALLHTRTDYDVPTADVHTLLSTLILQSRNGNWCDFNINLLLNICVSQKYKKDDLPPRDVLSKRPYVTLLLSKSKLPDHDELKDDVIAQELMRQLAEFDPQIFRNEDMRSSISTLACSLLSNAKVERDFCEILTVVERFLDAMSSEQKRNIADYIKSAVDIKFSMTETIWHCRCVLIRLANFVWSDDDVRWLRDETLESVSSHAKLKLIEIASISLKNPNVDNLLDALAGFLQDEDEDVRTKAAFCLSPHLCAASVHLSAPICDHLARRRFPRQDASIAESPASTLYFDVQPANVFAESKDFVDSALLSSLLSSLE